MTSRLRTLVTNDDGIGSDGLCRLAAAALDRGLDVVVAAPLREASGSSAAITAVEEEGRVVVEERSLPGVPGVPAYGVASSPAFIALIATRGAFGDPPDLVLSGVNRGANVGHAVLHSGTVGAALTGHVYGCRAMAVSLDVGLRPAEPPHWDTAAELAARLLPLVTESPRPVAVNLNVPDVPPENVCGVRRGTLASFGAVQTNLAEVGSGYVRVTVADSGAKLEPGTDASLLADGYACVTPLRFVCEAVDVALDLDVAAGMRGLV
jgi:5'-nucleotidase